jgi:N-acetylmuramoyl-L-alanine amidase
MFEHNRLLVGRNFGLSQKEKDFRVATRFHFTMPLRILLMLVVANSSPCLASSGELDGEDFRLRLHDPIQEARTTSVNYPGLNRQPLTTIKRAVAPSAVIPAAPPPSTFKVFLDAGHGGKDFGAQAITGMWEKNLSLRVTRLVRGKLETLARLRHLPIEIHVSRAEDSFRSLRERVQLANRWNADCFVSVHGNSSTIKRAHGFEIYFLSAEASDEEAKRLATLENRETSRATSPIESILSDVQATYHVTESSKFAETLFQSMAKAIPRSARGVRQAPFTVLAGTSMPAVLIELGYLTNPEEGCLLSKADYLNQLANAISSGILVFAQNEKRIL